MMVTIRRLVALAPVVSMLLAAMVLIAIPAVPVRATDPPPPPSDPPPPESPPPSAPSYTLVREPGFNPATPLRGRVQLVDPQGMVIRTWISPQPNDMLGLSAAVVPDVNGDGIADVVIGAPNAFDADAGVRIGTVRIASGADGSTISLISGTPTERFGLALAPVVDADGAAVRVAVLVEHLDPASAAPFSPRAFTYQVFDALSGGFIGESVDAPQGVSIAALRASIATHVRAVGAPDLDADGGVTPADFTILAGNYGAAVDPETGALLADDPTLAAAPTGDVNGDGVVDGDDLMEVVTGIGSNGTPGYEDGSGLTEAEAGVVQGAFAAATAGRLDCVHCALCHLGWCQVLPPEMEEDGPDPDTEPGDDGVTLPPGGDWPGGDPGPGGGECRDGDHDGDGILNKDDCDSPCPIDIPPCNGIDLDVHTNDAGSSEAVIDDKDEPLEASTTELGAWLLASIGDADGDLIPDFADLHPARPLAEVQLGLVTLDPANTSVMIEYEASDPNEVDTSGDILTISPAEGRARLWVLPVGDSPFDPRPITEGGHFVPPGTYTFEQIEVMIGQGLVLESVAPSESIGDIEIKATLLPDGISDTVRLTSFATGLFGVNAQGEYESIRFPTVSASAPVIQNTAITLANVRPTSDGTQLVADLTISGTVDDAASDLITGTAGIIGIIDLAFNGGDLIDGATNTLIQIPVSAQKVSQPASILKPHNFSGAFSRVIPGVPVQPGVNTVELTARNHFGDVGTATQGFMVDVRQPDQHVRVSLDFGLVPGDSDPFVQIGVPLGAVIEINEQSAEFTLWSLGSGIYADAGDLEAASIVLSIARASPFIPISPFWNDPGTVLILDGALFIRDACIDTSIVLVEDGVSSDTFTGEAILEGLSRPTWHCAEIESLATPLGPVVATGPGELAPFVIGLVGPIDDLIESATVGVAGEYSIIYEEIDDRMVGLLSPGGNSPAVLLARSSFELEGQGVFTPGPVAAVITLLESQAKFKLGVAQGLLDTGVNIYHGAAALGRIGGYAVWNYNPVSIRWRLKRGESPILAEDHARIAAATHAAQVLGEIALLITVNDNEFLSVVLQENATINALGEKYSEIGSVAAEILVDVLNHVEQEAQEIAQDPFKRGRLTGRVLGEVAAIVSPLAVAKIPQSAKALSVITRLRSIDEIAEIPGMAAKLDRLEDLFEAAATTAMCFAPGTSVWTDAGTKAIESLVVGDMVLAREEFTGEVGYRRVIDTITTHPDTLYHVTVRSSGTDEERTDRLSTTGEHPFFVVGRAEFVPAAELDLDETVWLASGTTARITDIQVERGPPGAPFTTYNIEVEGFHTYFVGDLGVWVHNSGAAACERAFRLWNRFKEKDGLDDITAFEKLRSKLPDATHETLGSVVQEIIRDRVPGIDPTKPVWTQGAPKSSDVNLWAHWIKRQELGQLQHLSSCVEYVEEAIALSRTTTGEVSSLLRVGWRQKSGAWEKVVLDMRDGKNGFVVKVVEGPNAGTIKSYFEVDTGDPIVYFTNQVSELVRPVGATD